MESQRLESGTYEIIRGRLQKQAEELRTRLDRLNTERREVFGTIELRLLANERITTENNCTPRDMVPVGQRMLFGYNVHIGLRSETRLEDVFALYRYEGGTFHAETLEALQNETFLNDFRELYRYFKQTTFVKFFTAAPYLYMVFQVGKGPRDVRVFKWKVVDGMMTYQGGRFEQEYTFPPQHEFDWRRTTREMHRKGKHPHISILDRVFVECIHGDLTVKIEDNTETGQGIYSEAVEFPDQGLDDAEVHFADVGNLILLRIRPYQEKEYRYLVFNDKVKEVKRIDAIAHSCILLPDQHGIIFSSGYYLQTGESKTFDKALERMTFERRMASPNGEDFLFVFFSPTDGSYALHSYNLIAQTVETPILCHGYSLFPEGQLAYFREEAEAQKHHLVQVFQTPYLASDVLPSAKTDSFLYKVGNKDLVRGMAECHEVLTLLAKDDKYANLYVDLVRKATGVLDSYYWINKPETQRLDEPLADIRTAASTAIDEFDKVQRVRKATAEATAAVQEKVAKLVRDVRNSLFETLEEYVNFLSASRTLRGECISLKDLRYVDAETVGKLDAQLVEQSTTLSDGCVQYLLQPQALSGYEKQLAAHSARIPTVTKVTDADALATDVDATANALQLLIDIVSNLKIADATETTRILDAISVQFAGVNQLRAQLQQQRKSLFGAEAQAEFSAQMRLLEQAVANFLGVADTPERTDEFLTKTMVQLEELEGKFAEFDDFAEPIATKREELQAAFEARKLQLVEGRNRRAANLHTAGDRILKGLEAKARQLGTVDEINAYFAADLMAEKLREQVKRLLDLGDSVKADDLNSRLKTLQQEAVRQLKDKKELFVAGENVIKFGRHHFNVNTQPLDLTVLRRGDGLAYHLTSTDFFQPLADERLATYRELWDRDIPSESATVYRAEYLAYCLFNELQALPAEELAFIALDEAKLAERAAVVAAGRYEEGYVRGVHDADAARILQQLLALAQSIDFLRYAPPARALAFFWWHEWVPKELQTRLQSKFRGIRELLRVFPDTREFEGLITQIRELLFEFVAGQNLFDAQWVAVAAEYMFHELVQDDHFVISRPAAEFYSDFLDELKAQKALDAYRQSLDKLADAPLDRFEMNQHWLRAYIRRADRPDLEGFLQEAATLFLHDSLNTRQFLDQDTRATLTGLKGTHAVIGEGGAYKLDYNEFTQRVGTFATHDVPRYRAYHALKHDLTDRMRQSLRLDEFKPKVLTSFVRNQLIDEVYLPLIGDNLAKQIGTAGANTRTDRMGMLLLISPPGYGKTTLMEYVASRLGLVFMKINGPAIGHAVTSVDPASATNAAARQELEKLNLAFEMGDNLMLYLDDIQHLHPEFLQKFISLADGTRRIEGVWNGRTRTYDFRGKKVAVVMAGNPYTESGEVFKIPDMLANRANVYNLGDVIGDTQEAFKRSYLENALTSNRVLAPLATRSGRDIRTLIQMAETGNQGDAEFESALSADELSEALAVLAKMVRVREVLFKVNGAYIHSAAQADAYRTEPPFRLQGSYRDMNKLTERIVPLMNDAELTTLLQSHYQNEAQTLTTGAEANLLKLRELLGWLAPADTERWAAIKQEFVRQQKLKGIGGNETAQVLAQLEGLTDGVGAIAEAIKRK